MMLAAQMYKQPDLVEKTLGETINQAQIFTEPTVEARLQSVIVFLVILPILTSVVVRTFAWIVILGRTGNHSV